MVLCLSSAKSIFYERVVDSITSLFTYFILYYYEKIIYVGSGLFYGYGIQCCYGATP